MLLPFFFVRWTRKSYVEDSTVFLNGIVYFVILYKNKKKVPTPVYKRFISLKDILTFLS